MPGLMKGRNEITLNLRFSMTRIVSFNEKNLFLVHDMHACMHDVIGIYWYIE